MAAEFIFAVSNPTAVRKAYTHIKVYRAASTTAMPAEVTGPTTRIALTEAVEYAFDDNSGRDTDVYRFAYFNRRTGVESDPSEWVLGQTDPALDVISVDELKKNYLFGVNLTDDNATEMPDSLFRWYIQAAVSRLEHELDLRLREFRVTAERHDYMAEEFMKFQWTQLKEYPVILPTTPGAGTNITVPAVRLTFPAQATSRDIPPEWVQVDEDAGQIELVPGAGALSLPFFGASGLMMPSISGGVSRYLPHVIEVDYWAGFPRHHVPPMIRHLAGMLASFGPLDIAGDLLGGAGVASYSIALDGLSQSVNTTSSPQYSGYGARLRLYELELKKSIQVVKGYYKGLKAFAV